MKNYQKYTLKPAEELASSLAAAQDMFVIACNKCFTEFCSEENAELDAFLALCKEQGKNVVGVARADFLCNSHKAASLPEMLPAEAKCVVALGCGLGIQTVAEAVELPVFAATDSTHYNGRHGMALTEVTCGACAQCYLNITGGICPIVDCSKSLVNGQCGGAKNGKCEVSPDKDCAWEKIQQHLASQGRIGELTAQPVQLRDYNKVNHKLIAEYVQKIRESRYDGYYGGVHPSEHKEATEHIALTKFPAPKQVVIPLSMHAGAPANPVVAVGDTVKMGQLIGEAAGFISANIHASVSGKVIAIEERPHANRGTCMAVVIENDFKDTLAFDGPTSDNIVELVKAAGIVGMGGAGFPTNVKLAPPKPIDTVLLNGCECEPMLTADHRVLLEYADDVIAGLQLMMQAVNAPPWCHRH